jgi:hypothetical protein
LTAKKIDLEKEFITNVQRKSALAISECAREPAFVDAKIAMKTTALKKIFINYFSTSTIQFGARTI